MSRYVIRFEKHGVIRYTSHLDMLRLFKRSFKRVGIRLEHSHGFNPHPKMNFAQPLSLGYESAGDYLEFDMEGACPPKEIVDRLNSVLPEGIFVSDCKEVPKTKTSLAARIYAGRYEIQVRCPEEEGADGIRGFLSARGESPESVLEAFLSQPEIRAEKRQKKTKKMVEVDIKPLILELKGSVVDDNHIVLTTLVRCGSAANLNPELIGQSLFRFLGRPFAKELLSVCRRELYGQKGDGSLISVMDEAFTDEMVDVKNTI